jgi:hypothetical protein
MKKTFYDYVNKTDSCWYWEGYINPDGYGVFKDKLAHRLAYLEMHGEYPTNTVTDHLCRVRHCVNPLHLEAVSRGENVRRGLSSMTTRLRHASKTHCPKGHELTPDNLYLENSKDGWQRRHCKTCTKDRRTEQYLRNKTISNRYIKDVID